MALRLPGRAAATRLWVLNLRELRSHRLRVITSLLVVVVSSALLVAVLGTYGSLTSSVRELSATVAGTADLEVAGISDTGLDDALAGEIRASVPAAAAAVPLIQSPAQLDRAGAAPTSISVLGSDYRITELNSRLRTAVQSGTGTDLRTLQDGVVVGKALGLVTGDRVTIGGVPVTVSAVIDSDAAKALNGGRYAFAYLGLAQRLTGHQGRLDSVLIKAAPGVGTGALRADLERVVNGRAVVVDPEFRAAQAETAGSVTRDSTLLIALISLVVAAFLVFNTMTMSVATRRPTLAMIRALGGRSRSLVTDLIAEAALFGLLGGLAGIPVGMLAGSWIIDRLPDAASDKYGATITFSLPAYVGPVAVAACVVACVAASALAARAVLSVSPVEALVPGEVVARDRRAGWSARLAGAVGVLLVGAAWLIVVTVQGRAAFLAGVAYAVGVLLICFAVTGALVRVVTAISSRLGGPGQLAAVNTERAPRRAWATLMTVAIAVTVGVGTSGAMNDLVGSVSRSLDGLGDPDLYVSSRPAAELPSGPLLDPSLTAAVARTPGVARVLDGQWLSVNLGEARVLLQGLTPGMSAPFVKRADPAVLRRVLAGDGLIVSTTLARTMKVAVGDRLRLATPAGFRELPVLQLVDYVAIDSGTAAIGLDLMRQLFDRPGATYLQVNVQTGADVAAVRGRIAAEIAASGRPGHVYTGADSLQATRTSVEQSGRFAVAIQWVVAVVAAVALLNTLLLSVIERRRDLGVLRAMGAARGFISRMVLAEAAAIAATGTVLGVMMGEVLHELSNRILATTTSVDIVYTAQWQTAVYVVVAFALCFAGAFFPAAQASRMTIRDAVTDE
ncbi:ABC transporter permease [Williamsia sterculiae]|uniref:Putative ABC transport system permease protein n=1 Tax=Williamsia sterculiae TaxID=1344003 RepID=A0A1N7CXK6_9NOCA|nr:FtsX-like permease family protein [Williamsia sterculiae]SIR68378.1 putative ABC transport system permease protein [Williamsia sterculiae]